MINLMGIEFKLVWLRLTNFSFDDKEMKMVSCYVHLLIGERATLFIRSKSQIFMKKGSSFCNEEDLGAFLRLLILSEAELYV